MDLMRQRNDVGLHGSQQDMTARSAGSAFQHFGHLGCGCYIGNAFGLDLRLQVGAQRPQSGTRYAYHYILIRQPDAAHRLPPQSLFFDDLANAVMNGAVLPALAADGRPHPCGSKHNRFGFMAERDQCCSIAWTNAGRTSFARCASQSPWSKRR